jgi:hypothetical protein
MTVRHLKGPIHVDEIWFVGSAYYYDLAFVRHDFANPDWQSLAAREAPPVARYLIGAALHLTGRLIETPDLQGEFVLSFAPIEGAWGYGDDFRKRQAMVDRMTPAARTAYLQTGQTTLREDDLRTGRILAGIFGALTVAGIYLLGLMLSGIRTAVVAAAAASLHPVMVELTRRSR